MSAAGLNASTIDIVFFDVGETLIRPWPSFHELFSRLARESDYDVAPEDVHAVQQRLAPHLVELAEETGIESPSLSEQDSIRYWSHLYRRLLGELGIEDEALVRKMFDTFSSTAAYKLYDDALPAIQTLVEANVRLGIISNFEGWLEEMLVELEVGHHFDVSVISGIVGIEKPDPGIYTHALEVAGVAGERAVHIGDSPQMDVEPARAVGMRPILLDRFGRYPDVEPRVESLGEIPNLLEKL